MTVSLGFDLFLDTTGYPNRRAVVRERPDGSVTAELPILVSDEVMAHLVKTVEEDFGDDVCQLKRGADGYPTFHFYDLKAADDFFKERKRKS